MYQWTAETLRFMEDACAYGDYFPTLADAVRPYFRQTDRVCDAGCGPGYLSLALAPFVGRLTAVDADPTALAVLRGKALAVPNLSVREGDIETLLPETPYDGMVFNFFGKTEQVLRIARHQCSGTVVIIKKNYAFHRFSAGEYPVEKDGFERAKRVLREEEIDFEAQAMELEFGQPFRCFEDIRSFFRCYSQDESPDVLTDDFLLGRIQKTGREDFPYYLPHRRKIGMIVIPSLR